MDKKKIGIVTDCLCDLPRHYMSVHNVGVLYFLIETDTGVFTDTEEVTADNIFEYIKTGRQTAVSRSPQPEAYLDMYERKLKQFENVIHIVTGAKVSQSYELAMKAKEELGEEGKRITVIDSMQVSSGIGHLVMDAVEMAESGKELEEIVEHLTDLRTRVSANFLLFGGEYLYNNDRISKVRRRVLRLLSGHPVLTMVDGEMCIKYVFYGDFNKAARKFVTRELKGNGKLNTRRMFITCSGSPSDKIALTKADVQRLSKCDELIVTKASATISTNCGPDSFGLIYVINKKVDK